jgi:AAA+ ATPase superfamily predicted ATPase
MNIDFENPFADYGIIISGERFIGRKESLEVIESRIVRPKEPGNLAIIGEPSIGKSSLVYKSIIDRKEEFIARKFIPIWINLATYDKSSIFFRSLVMRCMDEMEDLGWLSEPIQRAAERALEDELSWSEGYNRIQRFFEKVRKAGYRVLFILDEFDHARRLFKGDVSGFKDSGNYLIVLNGVCTILPHRVEEFVILKSRPGQYRHLTGYSINII